MEKQFVTFIIAKQLKELEFNEKCLMYWNDYGKSAVQNRFQLHSIPDSWAMSHVKAPLWQQVIDWFIEKHNIYINIESITFDYEPTYVFEIINLKNGKLLNDINSSFTDSSEAREQAVLKAIEIITQNKTI